MKRGQRAGVWAVAAVVGLSTGACGGTKEPLTFGTLQSSGAKVQVAIPTTQRADPKDWPAACSLVSSDEVQSLLPNSSVDLQSKNVKVVQPSSVDYTVPEGQCEIDTRQPGGEQNYPDITWVDVYGWGAPGSMAASLDGPGIAAKNSAAHDFGNTLGPQECVQLGGPKMPLTATIECVQGPLLFQVNGSVGSKTVMTGADSPAAQLNLWYERVVKPLVRAVAAHVPS